MITCENCGEEAHYNLLFFGGRWEIDSYDGIEKPIQRGYDSCCNPICLIETVKTPKTKNIGDLMEIFDFDGEEKPRLVELIKKALRDELEIDTIKNLAWIADPPKKQLKFPF
ncbi:MAG: hypothetical protein WC413_01465 [Candidatus Nanoarchaeia archaeon]